jgi:hypothetical protein
MYYRINNRSYGLVIFLLTLLWSGCSSNSNSGGGPILVTVTDQADNQMSSATVVLGDSKGAMKAHSAQSANR